MQYSQYFSQKREKLRLIHHNKLTSHHEELIILLIFFIFFFLPNLHPPSKNQNLRHDTSEEIPVRVVRSTRHSAVSVKLQRASRRSFTETAECLVEREKSDYIRLVLWTRPQKPRFCVTAGVAR